MGDVVLMPVAPALQAFNMPTRETLLASQMATLAQHIENMSAADLHSVCTHAWQVLQGVSEPVLVMPANQRQRMAAKLLLPLCRMQGVAPTDLIHFCSNLGAVDAVTFGQFQRLVNCRYNEAGRWQQELVEMGGDFSPIGRLTSIFHQALRLEDEMAAA